MGDRRNSKPLARGCPNTPSQSYICSWLRWLEEALAWFSIILKESI